MIHDFIFKDTPSKTHFAAITIHERGSDVPLGTLYQKTYGSNWILERRLSSTESESTNLGTEKKQRAISYARELTWDLAKRGLLNPSPQPSFQHRAHTARDENTPADVIQSPVRLFRQVLRALLPGRQ